MGRSENEIQLPKKIERLFSRDVQRRLLRLRQDIHMSPELSFQEEKTASRLADELALLQPAQLERIAGTAVAARFRGQDSSAPLVAIRGDIDALPIQEATNLEFASTTTGVMHACGHDVHATWIVGAATLLSDNPALGDVLLILQPAEEIGKGALAVLDSGILDGVSAIFGAHVDRRFTIGQIVAESGPIAASTDTFQIELIGSGAHGARPHESADPIVGASALINALQTIVSRRLNPDQPGVVSIGIVNAGTAPNIIPDRAELSGTLRATNQETRRFLQEEVRRIVERSSEVYRLKARIKIINGTPAAINHDEPTRWARQAVSNLLGKKAIVPLGLRNMGGEDFAYYLERIPGCFLRVGAREMGGKPISAHSPTFFASAESIFIGAAVLAETARIASASLSQ